MLFAILRKFLRVLQEAEAEEEGGAAAIADWDKAAADAAYQEEVERALEQQRLWEADQAKQAAALQQV